ncbi:hypothetical protein GZH46_00839, partial [Fragariocoptes setiger]
MLLKPLVIVNILNDYACHHDNQHYCRLGMHLQQLASIKLLKRNRLVRRHHLYIMSHSSTNSSGSQTASPKHHRKCLKSMGRHNSTSSIDTVVVQPPSTLINSNQNQSINKNREPKHSLSALMLSPMMNRLSASTNTTATPTTSSSSASPLINNGINNNFKLSKLKSKYRQHNTIDVWNIDVPTHPYISKATNHDPCHKKFSSLERQSHSNSNKRQSDKYWNIDCGDDDKDKDHDEHGQQQRRRRSLRSSSNNNNGDGNKQCIGPDMAYKLDNNNRRAKSSGIRSTEHNSNDNSHDSNDRIKHKNHISNSTNKRHQRHASRSFAAINAVDESCFWIDAAPGQTQTTDRDSGRDESPTFPSPPASLTGATLDVDDTCVVAATVDRGDGINGHSDMNAIISNKNDNNNVLDVRSDLDVQSQKSDMISLAEPPKQLKLEQFLQQLTTIIKQPQRLSTNVADQQMNRCQHNNDHSENDDEEDCQSHSSIMDYLSSLAQAVEVKPKSGPDAGQPIYSQVNKTKQQRPSELSNTVSNVSSSSGTARTITTSNSDSSNSVISNSVRECVGRSAESRSRAELIKQTREQQGVTSSGYSTSCNTSINHDDTVMPNGRSVLPSDKVIMDYDSPVQQQQRCDVSHNVLNGTNDDQIEVLSCRAKSPPQAFMRRSPSDDLAPTTKCASLFCCRFLSSPHHNSATSASSVRRSALRGQSNV